MDDKKKEITEAESKNEPQPMDTDSEEDDVISLPSSEEEDLPVEESSGEIVEEDPVTLERNNDIYGNEYSMELLPPTQYDDLLENWPDEEDFHLPCTENIENEPPLENLSNSASRGGDQ